MKTLFFFLILIIISCQTSQKDLSKDSFLNIKGNKIHFKSDGAGDAITFAHGGYLDLEMWEPQVEYFRPSHQVLRFSDIGHGLSVASDSSILGRDIINELLIENDIEKTTLVGLSWGAMLVVDFALAHPEKVKKLVLVSPGLNGWEYFQDSMALRNNKLRTEATEKNDTITAAKLFHQNWVLGPRRAKLQVKSEFYTKSLKMITENMRNHWFEDWSSLDTIQAINRLEEISVPTYIIIGDQDAEDIIMIANIYDDRIPNSEKTILRKLGHLLTLEDPEVFNGVLKKVMDLCDK